MQLTKLAGCQGNSCPAVYETDRGTLVVQGTIVTDANVQAPAGETMVEVPRELLASLQLGR
jgi:hypothetical protein